MDKTYHIIQALGKALSRFTHDLNNPMTVICGQVSIYEILAKQGAIDQKKLDSIFSKLEGGSEAVNSKVQNLTGIYSPLTKEDFEYDIIENLNNLCRFFHVSCACEVTTLPKHKQNIASLHSLFFELTALSSSFGWSLTYKLEQQEIIFTVGDYKSELQEWFKMTEKVTKLSENSFSIDISL